MTKANNLNLFREELKKQELDGFIVPHGDEYQNEYLPEFSERLAFLTGFTGSAGTAIVFSDKGALFVDGRYTIQAKEQVDPKRLSIYQFFVEGSPRQYLSANLKAGMKVGYDPTLHLESELKDFRDVCKQASAELVPCQNNPLDDVWHKRPPLPDSKVVLHPLKYAGLSSMEKRLTICKKLGADAAIISDVPSMNWLLNIRGSDLQYTPLALGFAVLNGDASVDVFLSKGRLSKEIQDNLEHVRFHDPHAFDPALKAMGAEKLMVRLDPEVCTVGVIETLKSAGASILRKQDPCLLPKACKNNVEAEGMRQAHIRDGVALTEFLAWFSRASLVGDLTELSAAERLLEYREKQDLFKGLSFNTISAMGPSGAIIHYAPSKKSDRTIEPNGLYLLDSGAQYLDGTTDVTRTVAVGKSSEEQRERFTRVLKGHIAIASARFPKGTTGGQLDALARAPLWEVGLDYGHGTGHGVGSYLNVHEGPQCISPRRFGAPLCPGMILSNEPGYYKEGEYGIRLESLTVVTPCQERQTDGQELLQFETLTMAPIDVNLIEKAMLNNNEKKWLNSYHKKVKETLSPLVNKETAKWLEKATEEI
ncbi:MAG: aminopeptidase P family protein [Alphaproteobacteria bacterium]|jgi:Xaa-Pro aminopeptidase|nr:aminopeptidase P family protein [Alphaproteobacteria bacterium]MBT5390490.1 aminopeptidase P family protein [Alphaproteobacteria bacterium]MBT5540632.1 aminopeptidase P family protein [Alphaproteobacteria bacterium]MBT5653980.1 aminopeptidase P family protein [Alphaproteobacteria bacterium]